MEFNETFIPSRQMAELKTRNDVVTHVLCILLIIIIKDTVLNLYVKLNKKARDYSGRNSKINIKRTS